MTTQVLWQNIESCLDSSLEDRRRRIDDLTQVQAVTDRAAGRQWTDAETFRGLVLAVLSGNTDWAKVERVKDDLGPLFSDFDLAWYAALPAREIGERFVPWFLDRKAGSVSLEKSLVNLIGAARLLTEHSRIHGSAENYFTSLLQHVGGDPKQAAIHLGSGREYKLPAFGVPLAAEALKNLGFAVAKPDRHVNRAVASFGLVPFPKWRDRSARKSPAVSSRRSYLAVMEAVEALAEAASQPVVMVDNAIWLLCARGELYLTNKELEALAPARGGGFRRPDDARIRAEKARVVRSLFIDTADDNYITARWCFVAGLNVDYFWLSVHALEKYMKAALLLNGRSTRGFGHDIRTLYGQVSSFASDLLPGKMSKPAKLKFVHWRDESPHAFIDRFHRNGNADNRYLIHGFFQDREDLFKLDLMVFDLRRLCVPLDACLVGDGRSGTKGPTHRDYLARHPEWPCPCPGGLLESTIGGERGESLRRVLLNLNLPFAPPDFEHDPMPDRRASRYPVLDFAILDPLKRAPGSPAAAVAAELCDWAVHNIHLPTEMRQRLCQARSTWRP